MIEKPKPDHDLLQEIIEGLYRSERIDYGTYSILVEYVIDCRCCMDPETDGYKNSKA